MIDETFNHSGYAPAVRPLAVRFLDWFTIHYAALKLPAEQGLEAHLEEAGALLCDPWFLEMPEPGAAELEFSGKGSFEFVSPVSYGPACNRRVPGWCFQSGPWKSRPAVILIHGYNAEPAYDGVMKEWAAMLVESGVNVLMFELPYHRSRRPGPEHAIRNFFCGDLLHVGSVFQQAFHEIQAMIVWLREMGASSVGLWGNSLGALMAGNVACLEGQADAVALLSPVARIGRALKELAFAHTMKRAMGESDLPLEILDLPTKDPKVDPQKIFVVSGRYDLFAPLNTQKELIQRWNTPHHRVCPEGHISILALRDVARKTASDMVRALQS